MVEEGLAVARNAARSAGEGTAQPYARVPVGADRSPQGEKSPAHPLSAVWEIRSQAETALCRVLRVGRTPCFAKPCLDRAT